MEKRKNKKIAGRCEDCLFYDMDEDGVYACTVSLDEDEFYRYVHGYTQTCPYYRYYDEYKSVQKQN